MINILLKREVYNAIFDLRMANKDEIERLKREFESNNSVKVRILIDEKVRYDQELKSELIVLDGEIMELFSILNQDNGKERYKEKSA